MKRVSPASLTRARRALDAGALADAEAIVRAVELEGDAALRRFVEQYEGAGPLVIPRAELLEARIPEEERALLERTAARISRFARAQRESIGDVDEAIEGGRAGHQVAPVESAGCYAPGGRYPLVSSVLMTAVTARAAGVSRVWVASPRPSARMCAAAAIAGADALLCAGGAHAIAALAYGTASVPAVDVIVGPGNRWVTAAKQLVSGVVGIDMLAGPSELVVVADAGAEAARVAADLLAQAEHDPDARVFLLATSAALVDAVERSVAEQLVTLSTREVAAAAWEEARAAVCSIDEAIAVCNALAPEHLHLHVSSPRELMPRLTNYGALFLGDASAEVLGDYGAGPNHVLPTGGTARFRGGLSVLTFLRVRTWLEIEAGASDALCRDAAELAELEGLSAHARSAAMRRR